MIGVIQKLLNTSEHVKTNGKARSPKWAQVRKEHLKKQPVCAVCGSNKKITVHHIEPFHLNPEKELDLNNLITLCEGKENNVQCHLVFGHFNNYAKKYNPNIVLEAIELNKKLTANIHS